MQLWQAKRGQRLFVPDGEPYHVEFLSVDGSLARVTYLGGRPDQDLIPGDLLHFKAYTPCELDSKYDFTELWRATVLEAFNACAIDDSDKVYTSGALNAFCLIWYGKWADSTLVSWLRPEYPNEIENSDE